VGIRRFFWIAAFGTALAVFAAAGCAQKPDYPPNLAFPSRTDLLVLKSAEITPTSLSEKQTVDEDIARFQALGGKTADPKSAPADVRTSIDSFLKGTFGTPAASKIAASNDPDVGAKAEALGLTPDSLTQGGKSFRYHCLKCHNITGDGRGPAANSMYPFPRDYRRGLFKFVSSGDGGKPRRADLMRTLSDGLRGTAMPPFGLLPETERDLLARYVTYLSIRGQVEFETFAAVLSGETTDVPGFASGRVKAVLAEWEKAESAPPVPPAPDDGEPGSPAHQAAVKRGYELFIRKADNSCITCHAEFGRKPVLRYDVWGTVAKPANLVATEPVYKGGARVEDLFARIRGGIAPVGMPAHPELSERQVWDLVRFVKSAPNPHELLPDVRKAVYPEMGEMGGAP
jgi:mono/diheme cytochrome c family protein